MTIRMATVLAAFLAGFGILLAACSSGSDVPQTAQESAASAIQSDKQQEQQPATSYQAGQSQTAKDETAAQPSTAEAGQDRQAAEDAGQTESAEQEQVAGAEPQASEQHEEAESGDEPTAEAEPEPEPMVGQIIETGHRAGLFANRNSVGDPDAPIVITEYSDFL